MKEKMKLLITSAGSLVSQNILDCLENKRNELDVIGMDANAANPRNFRYDRTYLVSPQAETNLFVRDFEAIVKIENPDLILAGRDHDVVFLSEIKERIPALKNKIPYGSAQLAVMMQDKYLSYQYAVKNNLPFADSYLYCHHQDSGGLESFLNKHPFPVLVKPRLGFGSLGVYYVLNEEQIDCLHAEAAGGEILFQEYLGPKQDFEKYARQLKCGVPLSFQIPETNQFAVQTVISAEGIIADYFISINTMVAGRAEYSKQISNQEIEDVALKYADVLYRDGWYGPLNVQLKQDQQGLWKVFEMNPRMTGTTSARYLLGYDEIGIITDYFVPKMEISNHTKTLKQEGVVFKYLTDYYLSKADTGRLEKSKVWKKS